IMKKKEDLNKGHIAAEKIREKWDNWAESKKVDIQAKSANAVLDTYSALAKGQIKSLEDFKKFAKMQLAELLLAKGQEHASLAISDTAKGISFAANPLTASLAPPEFMSAAKNAALAATWGVAAATLNSSDENEESNSNNEVTESKYDDGIEKRSELGKGSEEQMVYIDMGDSAISKLLIKQIEKELNDGHNCSLFAKRNKR
ncbi:MAG: phage tail tape measure protein, partial [Fusobacterium sp.]